MRREDRPQKVGKRRGYAAGPLPPGWTRFLPTGPLPPGWTRFLSDGPAPSRMGPLPPGWPAFSRMGPLPPGWAASFPSAPTCAGDNKKPRRGESAAGLACGPRPYRARWPGLINLYALWGPPATWYRRYGRPRRPGRGRYSRGRSGTCPARRSRPGFRGGPR